MPKSDPESLALRAEIKMLRETLGDAEARAKRLLESRNEVLSKLDATTHENRHLQQTVRSLHWALNSALSQMRVDQLREKKFGADAIQWEKRDELALAM